MTCAAAAGGGHLDVLIWARQNNCPWDVQTIACSANKEMRQWAIVHGCPVFKGSLADYDVPSNICQVLNRHAFWADYSGMYHALWRSGDLINFVEVCAHLGSSLGGRECV
jgi:hypothetical protein